MKYLAALIAILSLFLFISPVLADDPPGLVVDITIIGDNPATGVQIEGDSPLTGVLIDGDSPTTLVDIDGLNSTLYINGHDINQTVGAAISGGIQQATPNSQYSQASTGVLPPLGLIPAVNAVAPGKYTQSVIGGMGYLGPTTNENPFVYKGAGCGMWGVSDGYPDLWSRRQMVGVTVDLTVQREKLEQTQMALVKVIGELKNNSTSFEAVNSQLGTSLDTLSGVVTDLAVIEEENLQFRENTVKQFDNLYMVIIILSICVIVGFIAIAIFLGILLKSRKFN
jgi:hypothetical protein